MNIQNFAAWQKIFRKLVRGWASHIVLARGLPLRKTGPALMYSGGTTFCQPYFMSSQHDSVINKNVPDVQPCHRILFKWRRCGGAVV